MRNLLIALVIVTVPATAFAGSLSTVYNGTNSNYGAMFDLTVLNPDGIRITSFDFNHRSGWAVGPADVEVYYVTDHTTYVDKGANASLWTLLGSDHIEQVNPNGTPTPVDIGGLKLAYGETCGIYFTRTDNISLQYSNGPLGAFANDDLRFEDRGQGARYPFGANSPNRIWNGTVHYEVVPEPTALALLALGLCLVRRR